MIPQRNKTAQIPSNMQPNHSFQNEEFGHLHTRGFSCPSSTGTPATSSFLSLIKGNTALDGIDCRETSFLRCGTRYYTTQKGYITHTGARR
jgi:hypothetical protein